MRHDGVAHTRLGGVTHTRLGGVAHTRLGGVAHTRLGLEAGIALLKHRCRLINFDEAIDEAGIHQGDPIACTSIIRYLFTRFSQALSEHLDHVSCHFDEAMSEELLIDKVIGAWPFIATERTRSLGRGITSKNVLARGYAIDRLLFTLQCIFVCTEKHRVLVRHNSRGLDHPRGCSARPDELERNVWDESVAHSPKFLSPAAQSVNDTSAEEDTVRWMIRAYREQLSAVVDAPAGGDSAGGDSAGGDSAAGAGNLNGCGSPPDPESWLPTLAHLDDEQPHEATSDKARRCLAAAVNEGAPQAPHAEHGTYLLESIAKGRGFRDERPMGCRHALSTKSHTKLGMTDSQGEASIVDAEMGLGVEPRGGYETAIGALNLATENDLRGTSAFDEADLEVSFINDCI